MLKSFKLLTDKTTIFSDLSLIVKYSNSSEKYFIRIACSLQIQIIQPMQTYCCYQCGVDEAVRGWPRLRRNEAVQGELLLGAVHRRDVVRRVALLSVRVHLHRPVTVLWHKSVDSDCLRLYPCLLGRTTTGWEVTSCHHQHLTLSLSHTSSQHVFAYVIVYIYLLPSAYW